MDNLTHTLISAMVGEAIHRSTPASSTLTESSRRNVAITVMVVGGNLPDIDLVHTGGPARSWTISCIIAGTPTRSSAR